MRAILQRVQYANITINQTRKKSIDNGLLVLLGIENNDSLIDAEWLAGKIARLRIFADKDDKMNLSVQDIDGEIMLVSQFTLHASTKKGNRPSWIKAADPELAEPLYLEFINLLQVFLNKKIISGEFGAHMDIELLNDGPVTIFFDTKNKE
jgi:D-tyrosyl-tRNA(Tyr) deacylase